MWVVLLFFLGNDSLKFFQKIKVENVTAGVFYTGGKSGQRRVGCWLTARQRELTESAAENIPPMAFGHR